MQDPTYTIHSYGEVLVSHSPHFFSELPWTFYLWSLHYLPDHLPVLVWLAAENCVSVPAYQRRTPLSTDIYPAYVDAVSLNHKAIGNDSLQHGNHDMGSPVAEAPAFTDFSPSSY